MRTFYVLEIFTILLLCSGCNYNSSENWKRRWSEDTAELSAALKVANQKVADESYKRSVAENKVLELESEIAKLREKLANAKP